MRADIAAGLVFPENELIHHAKTRRRLSEPWGNDSTDRLHSRERFGPKDHRQHLEVGHRNGGSPSDRGERSW